MSGGKDLSQFSRKLLAFPPLIIAAISLPMALRLIPPNRIYGFRTAASLASRDVWYTSNFWAGMTGVALGITGAFLIHTMLKRGPLDVARAVLAGGVAVFVALASLAAGLLTS